MFSSLVHISIQGGLGTCVISSLTLNLYELVFTEIKRHFGAGKFKTSAIICSHGRDVALEQKGLKC
jgi:hypothetical protein